MGRLEKQIIIGALVLVGVLLSVVVITGLQPRDAEATRKAPMLAVVNIPLDGAQGAESEGLSKPKQPAWPITPKASPKALPKGVGSGAKNSPAAASKGERQLAKPQTSSQPPKVRRYTIQSGDTLSEIAQKQLGSSKPAYVQDILDVNPGVTAQNIQPGDVLILPARGSHTAKVEEALLRPKQVAAATGVRTHKIVSGDSLWVIARKYYGIGNESKGIARIVAVNAELTDGKNSVLKIGKVLVIPK